MARRTKGKSKSSRSSGASRGRKATGYRGGAGGSRTKGPERGGGQTLHDERALSPDVTADTGTDEILPAGPGGNMEAERRRMVGYRGSTPAPESRRSNPEVEPEARLGPDDTPPAA